jgi:FkbM family methyltransferase
VSARKYSIVTVLIGIVLVALGWVGARKYYAEGAQRVAFFGMDGLSEVAPILEKYGTGTGHSSRNFEEWIIRDYFQDRSNGIFLDVGANDYRDENNTYYLETKLGWSGVAIDALEEFAPGYREHRKRTQFFALFVSDAANGAAQFFVPEKNKLVASVSREFTEQEGTPGIPRTVPTTTLDAVLAKAGISRVDFLSMDIELSEPKALAGFDIDRFHPALACVEGHPEVRQQILDYFARHRYTMVGKYLRSDPKNLYFKPLDN